MDSQVWKLFVRKMYSKFKSTYVAPYDQDMHADWLMNWNILFSHVKDKLLLTQLIYLSVSLCVKKKCELSISVHFWIKK